MNRHCLIEFSRVIASVLVICIHFNPFGNVYSPMVDAIVYDSSPETVFLAAVVSRLAVPFFFITTGYFLATRLTHPTVENKQKINTYLIGILKLLSLWAIMYFVCFSVIELYETKTFIYEQSIIESVVQFVSVYVYHLWYLSALIVGVFICSRLLQRFSLKTVSVLGLGLYLMGVLGDAYNGLLLQTSADVVVNAYNGIFLTTRNGIFMALPFITLGVVLATKPLQLSLKWLVPGFIVSFGLMTVEVFWLIAQQIPRDYNMTFMLPLVSVCLFELLLIGEKRIKMPQAGKLAARYCGKLSLYIYLTHVLIIVIVRDLLKVEARGLGFLMVVALTFGLAAILTVGKTRFMTLGKWGMTMFKERLSHTRNED